MNTDAERGEPSGDRETLQILIGGARGEPEQLFLIQRPTPDGRVRIRVWTSEDWSAAPTAVVRASDELLREIEGWSRAGRTLTQPLSVIRHWLEGAGSF